MYIIIFSVWFALSFTTTTEVSAAVPAPTGLRVQIINVTTAIAHWDPVPKEHVQGVLIGYIVILYRDPIWYRQIDCSINSTNITLTDLKDWEWYTIRVYGYTANETGSNAYLTFQTPTITSPTGLSVSKLNFNTLEARWNIIQTGHADSEILGYRVQLRQNSYNSILYQIHNINQTRIVINNLPLRLGLCLYFQGFTINETTKSTYYTMYSYAIQPPTGMKVTVNGTSVAVQWDPIPSRFVLGDLIGYRLQVYHYHPWLPVNTTKTNDTNIVVRQLFPGSSYYIDVAGYTANETGATSNQYFVTGCGGVVAKQLTGNINLKSTNLWFTINCTWRLYGVSSMSMVLMNVDTLNIVSSLNCRERYLKIRDAQGKLISTLCGTRRWLNFVSFGYAKIEFFVSPFWSFYEMKLSYVIIPNGIDKAPIKDSWNISATTISSTFITVNWGTYPGQDIIKNFVVVCTAQNNYSSIFTATADRNQSKVDVTNLLKNTEYKVEVIALLDKYWNKTNMNQTVWKSLTVRARTLEDVPSKPPDNVKAVTSGATSILVSWNSLVDTNGVIVGYNVYYQMTLAQGSFVVKTMQNKTKILLKNLQQATEYKITVSALTRAGEGPKGRSVYVTTGCQYTLKQSSGGFQSPYYPRNYPSSADCTWTIAQDIVFDQLFILFWSFDLEEGLHGFCSDFVKVLDHKGNQLMMTCGRKSRFAVMTTKFAVVKLHSDQGIEKSGFTGTYFTLNNLNRVINLNVNGTTTTQASVNWYNPKSHPRRFYAIFYRDYERKGTWNFTIANDTHTTITGLQPSTQYELLVTESDNFTSYGSYPKTFVTQSLPTTKPTEEKPTEFVLPMYEYGPKTGDKSIPNTWFYTHSQCKKVTLNEDGFLYMTERHHEIYICRNGVLRFESPYYVHWPVYLGSTKQSCQLKMLAPYWCLADRSQSTVYYHVYQTSDKSTKSNKVLERATDEVIKLHKGAIQSSFKASWVLVVTWNELRHFTQNKETKDLRNTFQAVLITDGLASFAMYNYPIGGIQWSAPTTSANWKHFNGAKGLPVVGWIAGKCGDFVTNNVGFFNVEKSATVNIANIGRAEGHSLSITKEGVKKHQHSFLNKWLFQLYMPWRTSVAYIKCKNWFKKQPDPRPFLEYLEPCPCTSRQAWFDERFTPEKSSSRWSWSSNPRPCAISSFYSIDGWEQKCCYSHEYPQWGALVVGHLGGGYAHRFSKIHKGGDHMSHDVMGYKHCCVDSSLCHLFYQRRPSDDCSRYEPPEWSWMWGDPHIVTLDGTNYTFNGLGEYIMLDARDGFFQLHTRTRLAKGDGTATIFCAAVMKEVNSSTVQLSLEKDGNITILIDGVSMDFYKLTNETKRLNGSVVISRPKKNEFRATYPSGISVTLAESKGALTILAALPRSLKNQTKGLLGTWNGEKLDDFTTPSGRVLSANSTSRTIHFAFGQQWQVNETTSLFEYANNESIFTFSNTSFMPMFIDELKFANQTLEDEARQKCGDDINCLFDAASTKDVSMGLETKVVGTQMINDSVTLKNSPPKFSNNTDAKVMLLKVNTTKYLDISAQDPDGDSIRFDVTGLPQGGVVTRNSSTVLLSWNVTMNQIDIQIIATDSKGASSVFKPFFKLCACQNGASCIDASSQNENRFTILSCGCTNGYTGKYCEADIDACKVNLNPCYPGVKCEDRPAPANETGYECGSCPVGFTGMGDSCQDIDECSGIQRVCEQNCYNSPGSYVCGCRKGFELKTDGRTCQDINECQPTSDCMHLCENTIGSYRCKCNKYFKADPTDSKKCIPESPCKDGNHQCQDICYESNGIATCACSMGYELQSDKKTCQDVDECKIQKNRCNQLCQNTVGGYDCACVSGFRLSVDNVTCVDINECIEWTFKCPTSQRCHNTMGSYQCKCDECLYWIDGRCQELPTGEKVPTQPPPPTPPTPSQDDLYNSVNVTIKQLKISEWDLQMDLSFKKGVAREVTTFCARENKCPSQQRRERRSNNYIVFTSDQVHLLPGYPVQILDSIAVVAFYVKFPSDNHPSSSNTVDGQILADVINGSLSRIGQDIGKSLLSVAMYQYRSESTTELPHTTSSSTVPKDSKMIYIIVGCSAAVAILVIVIIVACYCKKQSYKRKVHEATTVEMQHYHDPIFYSNPTSCHNLK